MYIYIYVNEVGRDGESLSVLCGTALTYSYISSAQRVNTSVFCASSSREASSASSSVSSFLVVAAAAVVVT
jgi:hypothetical protein